MAYFKVLPEHSTGRTEENYGKVRKTSLWSELEPPSANHYGLKGRIRRLQISISLDSKQMHFIGRNGLDFPSQS